MSPLGLGAAVVIGVSLGFFGGGGSILTVPLLVYGFGLEPKQAIASSLLIVAIASSSGVLQHLRAGRVEVRAGLVFGAAGILSAFAGARIGRAMDGHVLLLLFASMMALTAVAMWRGRRASAAPSATQRSTGRLAAQGAVVGLVTGTVGAGGGFLIVPALALWAGLPMPAAIGTSLLVIVLNCLSGFAGYLGSVPLDAPLIASVAGCAVAGTFVGTRLARGFEPARLRRAFAGFVALMAVVILAREGSAVGEALQAALPRTGAQVLFAVLLLGAGVLAGRTSRSLSGRSVADVGFEEGSGI